MKTILACVLFGVLVFATFCAFAGEPPPAAEPAPVVVPVPAATPLVEAPAEPVPPSPQDVQVLKFLKARSPEPDYRMYSRSMPRLEPIDID